MADILNTPQFSYPFRVGRMHECCIEQDSDDDRVQNARIVLRYTRGDRAALPDFGIPDLTFTEGEVNLDDLVGAIRSWEPDVEIDDIVQAVSAEGITTIELTFGSSREADRG